MPMPKGALKMPRPGRHKKLGLAALSTLLALGLLEAGLRLFTVFPVQGVWGELDNDDKLIYRLKPRDKEIDARGFRNQKALDHADLVALGDSHTYGVGLASEQTWPCQLGRMMDASVYNLGVWGYGIVQYYALMDQALALKPRDIVVGLYLHNDINDMCSPFKTQYWKEFAESRGWHNRAVADCIGVGEGERARPWSLQDTAIASAFTWLVADPLVNRRVMRELRCGPAVVINDDKNQTRIIYRRIHKQIKYVDMSRPRNVELAELARQLFREMKQKADLNGVRLAVLLIPSKENVFYDYLRERGYQLPPEYDELVRDERALNRDFAEFFAGIGVLSVDALPYMVPRLSDPGNIYPEWADYHPLEPGQKAYAEAVYNMLKGDRP